MQKNFKKHQLQINSKTTVYWEKNHAKKNTIIILHGFPGSHTPLLDFANNLDNYRVIIPDLPANGESEKLDTKHTLKNYANWLNSFMANLNIKQAVIIGHSFGGRVSLIFAKCFPKKVQKLALITPVLKADGILAKLASLHFKMTRLLPEFLQKIWLYNRLYKAISRATIFKSASPERRKELNDMDDKTVNRLSMHVAFEIFDEFYRSNLVNGKEKVKTKTLIIAGDKDQVSPLKTIKKLAKTLPHAELTVVPGAGHILVLEEPIKTATIVKNWLSQ